LATLNEFTSFPRASELEVLCTTTSFDSLLGSFWSSTTYAEVLPPTVSHLMVASSPLGWEHGQKRFFKASGVIMVNQFQCMFCLFAFPLNTCTESTNEARKMQREETLTQRCLKSQFSGYFVSSALHATAIWHTFSVASYNALICAATKALHRCSGWTRAWYKISSVKV
jgi:hypothetical protein